MTRPRCLLVLSCVAAACWNAGCGDATPPAFSAAPSIATNPNPAVPLAAVVSAETDEPAALLITVSDGEHEWTVPVSPELGTRHSLPVLGFRPGSRASPAGQRWRRGGQRDGSGAVGVRNSPPSRGLSVVARLRERARQDGTGRHVLFLDALAGWRGRGRQLRSCRCTGRAGRGRLVSPKRQGLRGPASDGERQLADYDRQQPRSANRTRHSGGRVFSLVPDPRPSFSCSSRSDRLPPRRSEVCAHGSQWSLRNFQRFSALAEGLFGHSTTTLPSVGRTWQGKRAQAYFSQPI